MKKNTLHTGFTLVEVIIAISIFSIMMVGVLSIFLFSSQMATRVELNRLMQENVKNVFEDVAEEVRKGKIISSVVDQCPSGSNLTISATAKNKLCLSGGVEYFIGNKLGDTWVRVSDLTQCSEFVKTFGSVTESEDDDNICRILKKDSNGAIYPLTNSFVAIEALDFFVNNSDIPKVHMRMILRPAARKGLAVQILDNNRMYVQTSISERFIRTQ